MAQGLRSLFPKVFDSSSLISIEKSKRMPALRARKDEVILPRKVAEEVASQESPLRRFVKRNPAVITDLTPKEQNRFLELMSEPNIDAGEAAAISVAEARGHPLVIADGAARRRAVRLGVNCIAWRDFVDGRVQ
jgi:predicted nucleic acid-binding protein